MPKTIVTQENIKKSVIFINNVTSKPNRRINVFEQLKTFEKIFHLENGEWYLQEIEDKWLSYGTCIFIHEQHIYDQNQEKKLV